MGQTIAPCETGRISSGGYPAAAGFFINASVNAIFVKGGVSITASPPRFR
jgi:hypothetical protein